MSDTQARAIYDIWRPMGTDPVSDKSWAYLLERYSKYPDQVPSVKAAFASAEIGRKAGLEEAASEADKYAHRRAHTLSEQVANKALGATEVSALIRALIVYSARAEVTP